jgi:hypothetical protein
MATRKRNTLRNLFVTAGMCIISLPILNGAPAEEAVQEVEDGVLDRIRALYRDAILDYNRKDYGEAEQSFHNCLALYQASEAHLSNPQQLSTVRKGCERYLSLTRRARKIDAAANGLQARLEQIVIPEFRVREASVGSVIEELRQTIGKLTGSKPPAFLVQLPEETSHQRISVELRSVPLSFVLTHVASLANANIRYERHATVFVPTIRSSTSPDVPQTNVQFSETKSDAGSSANEAVAFVHSQEE